MEALLAALMPTRDLEDPTIFIPRGTILSITTTTRVCIPPGRFPWVTAGIRTWAMVGTPGVCLPVCFGIAIMVTIRTILWLGVVDGIRGGTHLVMEATGVITTIGIQTRLSLSTATMEAGKWCTANARIVVAP